MPAWKRGFLRLAAVSVVLLSLTSVWLPVSVASPPPAALLLVTHPGAANPFGSYLAEILRAEGLNSFEVVSLADLTAGDLSQHAVTLLAETPLSSTQAELFTNHVNAGGRLIAMRPDSRIRALFGLGASAGTLSDGYLRIDTTATLNGARPGAGLAGVTLQIHGAADRYTTLPGAVTLAKLYTDKTTATAYPAVVAGVSGRAVAFNYDLARNVVYTRQGNPANANIDVDGDTVLRTVDLFQGAGGGAPWVDRDRIAVPQADEQQRFLARLVSNLLGLSQPMPQLWYFPGTARTMLILTGDAHANPTSYYTNVISSVNAYGGKMTFYLSTAADPDDTSLQAMRADGHEFGIHPYAYQPPNIENLAEGYQAFSEWYDYQYSTSKSRTARNHQVAWLGWTEAADIAAAHGIAMETNFYHWGPWLQTSGGAWPHGYLTGSGRPMRFARADGSIVPVYQQATQLVDEQLLDEISGAGLEGLGAAEAISVSQELIDASLAGDYAALTTQFHVDYYGVSDARAWAEGTMVYANTHGVPLWNADRWLSFTETRHDANYTNIEWNRSTGVLTFTLNATATPGINLTTMLPLTYNQSLLQSVAVDGSPHAFSTQTIKGVNVAFAVTPPGNHAFAAAYSTNAGLDVSLEPDGQTILHGATVTFTIAVTNTGDADLSNVQVSDALAPDCDANLGALTAGATASYPCSRANVTASFTNTAVASGTPPVGPAVSASDSAPVSVVYPTPIIAGLDPITTTAGGPALTLTVNGSGYSSGSVIRWNGTALTTSFVSATQLTATIEAARIATTGTASITVLNPAPGGGASNTMPLTIAAPPLYEVYLPAVVRSVTQSSQQAFVPAGRDFATGRKPALLKARELLGAAHASDDQLPFVRR